MPRRAEIGRTSPWPTRAFVGPWAFDMAHIVNWQYTHPLTTPVGTRAPEPWSVIECMKPMCNGPSNGRDANSEFRSCLTSFDTGTPPTAWNGAPILAPSNRRWDTNR
jgi:hypothetical protein